MPEQLDLDSIIFPFFAADIEKPYPIGRITLRQFLRSHKRPNESTIKLIGKIKEASDKGDLKLKDELKKGLYCFTPSVNIDGVRRYSNIISFNNIAVLDFDKINHAEEFKHFLFNALPSVICAYTSPSRRGVKFLVKIGECNSIEDYKSFYFGLAYHLEKYEGFDPCTANAILPLFLSYDEDLLFRPDPETWEIKGEKIDSFQPFVGDIEVMDDVSEDDVRYVKNILRKSLEKITDNGHSVVVSTSIACGGYISAGYLSEEDGVSFLEEVMHDIPYLHKSMGTYIKTMRSGVKKGMSSPLYLKEKTN